MMSPKQVERLFSEPSKEAKELDALYKQLALEVARKTRPNDLSREAILLLRESLDKIKAAIAMNSEDGPY